MIHSRKLFPVSWDRILDGPPYCIHLFEAKEMDKVIRSAQGRNMSYWDRGSPAKLSVPSEVRDIQLSILTLPRTPHSQLRVF